MEVSCCPKCAKDSHVKMRPNDPMEAFYHDNMLERKCTSCGQYYSMTWIQWLTLAILGAIFVGVLEAILGDSLLATLFEIGVVLVISPLLLDAVQSHLPWKPVDATYFDSAWRFLCPIFLYYWVYRILEVLVESFLT